MTEIEEAVPFCIDDTVKNTDIRSSPDSNDASKALCAVMVLGFIIGVLTEPSIVAIALLAERANVSWYCPLTLTALLSQLFWIILFATSFLVRRRGVSDHTSYLSPAEACYLGSMLLSSCSVRAIVTVALYGVTSDEVWYILGYAIIQTFLLTILLKVKWSMNDDDSHHGKYQENLEVEA